MMEIKMRAAWVLFCGAVVAAGAGCGGGDSGGSSYEIASGTLAGKINGTSWTFQSGLTDSFLSDDKAFFTTLHAEKIDMCGGTPTSGADVVLLNIPKTVDEYDLSISRNVTLAHGSDNKVSTTGLLSVEKITDTTIEAGLYAIFEGDPNYEVSGHFTATICPAMP